MGFFTKIGDAALKLVPKTQVIDERRNEIATVQVKDIKEYLVQEYERSKQLYQKNQELTEELEKTEETKTKYEAALVTLQAYDDRLKEQEITIKRKDDAINLAKAESRELRNELNDYKIRFSKAALDKESIRQEVVDETKKRILDAIMDAKGNLSKSKVIEIIDSISVYEPRTVKCEQMEEA